MINERALIGIFNGRKVYRTNNNPVKHIRKTNGTRRPVNAEFRPFVAWDGEGTTSPGAQPYVYFANSEGGFVQGENLSTWEMLDLIIRTEMQNPDVFHVGFAFDYDVNQILKDLPRRVVVRLYRHGSSPVKVKCPRTGQTRFYRIKYIPKKFFTVSTDQVGGAKWSATIYDVFSFFGTSFVVALKEFWKEANAEIARIEADKKRRNEFRYEEIDHIAEYCQLELKWLVDLCQNLRRNLYAVGFSISSWHGPGAIANHLFTEKGIVDHMARFAPSEKESKRGIGHGLPKPVELASTFAYMAGRFQLGHCGNYEGKVFQFDIRSAYPAAIRQLPSLQNGYWRYVERPTEVVHFGVYHVRTRDDAIIPKHVEILNPMPFFYRNKDGAISFPARVDGWYWSPEAALAFADHLPEYWEVVEGWEFVEDDSSVRPFGWVEEIYEERARRKRAGDQTQMALKLALNSLYGKMAQRIGWDEEGDEIPTFHQLEWAGWVTSWTRRQMFDAIDLASTYGKWIGSETDGITTTVDLSNPEIVGRRALVVGEGLGEWEKVEHQGITYVQNGLYWLKAWDKEKGGYEWKAKIRGLDRDSLISDEFLGLLDLGYSQAEVTRISVLDFMRSTPHLTEKYTGSVTRFYGIGQAAVLAHDVWRHWITSDREIAFGGGQTGKAIHVPFFCGACKGKDGEFPELHRMTNNDNGFDGASKAHVLKWLQPRMTPEEKRQEWERKVAVFRALYESEVFGKDVAMPKLTELEFASARELARWAVWDQG